MPDLESRDLGLPVHTTGRFYLQVYMSPPNTVQNLSHPLNLSFISALELGNGNGKWSSILVSVLLYTLKGIGLKSQVNTCCMTKFWNHLQAPSFWAWKSPTTDYYSTTTFRT